MSQKYEVQSCQWYGVKQIKSFFADKGMYCNFVKTLNATYKLFLKDIKFGFNFMRILVAFRPMYT